MTTLTDRCDEAMARAMFVAGDPQRCASWDRAIAHPDSRKIMCDGWLRYASAARVALLAALDADGWQLAPKMATAEMIAAVRRLDWKSQTDIDWPDGYAAMIAAAPHPFPEDKP